MGEQYASRVILEVNGAQIEDFDKFEEGDIDYNAQVKLMNKTGFMSVLPRYTMTVGYVKPLNGEFDWSSVRDGRLTVEYENGDRVTYTGVFLMKKGKETSDGENAIKRDIELGASDRIEE
jgi:hypothetical protein